MPPGRGAEAGRSSGISLERKTKNQRKSSRQAKAAATYVLPPTTCARERAQVERLEFLADVVELPPERLDPFDLIGGGLSLPGEQSSVRRVEVLADALLARDRSPLLRRHDLLFDRIEPGHGLTQLFSERLGFGNGRDSRGDRLSGVVDPIDEHAHVLEERVGLHDGVELRLSFCNAVRRAAVDADVELRLEDLVTL